MAYSEFSTCRTRTSLPLSQINFRAVPSPCFVLDERAFLKNLEILKLVQENSGADIILALKGFAMWRAFPEIKKHFSGAAASSFNEARLCFEELGFRAHVYAPAYSEGEFQKILPYADHITFNSFSQFEKFRPQAEAGGHTLGIRINPGYSPVAPLIYNPCAPGSRLGEPIDMLPDPLPSGLEGFHLHALCESGPYVLEKVLNILETKCSRHLSRLKWINLGGGHLITGERYNVRHLISLLSNFQKRHGLSVVLEPGAAFAWNAGYLAARVLDIVENGGIATAMLNVSFAAHMPDCLEMPYRPRVVGQEDENGRYTYRLGGNTCLAGDFLESYQFNKPLNVGDIIVFEDMMHYTMVKSTFFNGIGHPSLGIWRKTGRFELWKEFGYEDYKGRLS